VGAVASTIRKIAMATAHRLVSVGVIRDADAHHILTIILFTMKSVLGDDDAVTRRITVTVLTSLFNAMGPSLDDDGVRQLYPELMKRLDDSNDDIRVGACTALAAFFGAAPSPVFGGGPVEHVFDALLIHMDDPDGGIQAAATDAAAAAARHDMDYARRKLGEALTRMRDPTHARTLLAALGEE
jgi:dynein assembly factor 5